MQKPAKKCLYCGNNQTHHPTAWLSQTMTVMTTPLNTAIIGGKLGQLVSKGLDLIAPWVIKGLKAIGMITYNNDIEKSLGFRGKVLWEEATNRGIIMQNLVLFGKPLDVYRAVQNGRELFFVSLPRPYQSKAEVWMDDKALLKKKLQAKNIPVSPGGSFSSYRSLKKAFEKWKSRSSSNRASVHAGVTPQLSFQLKKICAKHTR